jgi:hypothetical protein
MQILKERLGRSRSAESAIQNGKESKTHRESPGKNSDSAPFPVIV